MLRHGNWLVVAGVLLALLMLARGTSADVAKDVTAAAVIYGCDRINGTVPTTGAYFFQAWVEGTNIDDVRYTDASTNAALTYHAGDDRWYYNDPVRYDTAAALHAAHPQLTLVDFYWNEAAWDNDHDQLGYNVIPPGGFATITNPPHNSLNQPLDPLYQWNSVAGTSNAQGLYKGVRNIATDTLAYEEVFNSDLNQTSWQPGALDPLTGYEFTLCVVNLVYDDPVPALTDRGDPYTYYGVWAQCNTIQFSTQATEIPEPGTIALVGSAMLALVGLRWRRRMR